MATEELRRLVPDTFEQAAAELAEATAQGHTVRIRGGGSKAGWGRPVPDPPIELSTAALDRTLEHNPGDFTAIVQAGAPLARVQDELAGAGQMLALDPPLGAGRTQGDDRRRVRNRRRGAAASPLRRAA